MASFKPNADDVARMAAQIATGEHIPYNSLKCDAFIEKCINDCGASPSVNWAGTNDMVRNAMDFVRPLTGNYLAEIQPGDLLFIKADSEADLPATYRGDGIGDFNHVGVYVGNENAFWDVDKNGKEQLCNVAHSSSTMGRVAGSRLEKKTVSGGWGYRAQAGCVNYGAVSVTVPEMSEEEYLQEPTGGAYGEPTSMATASRYFAVVSTPNGGAVNMRAEPSTSCDLYKEIPNGETVQVIGQVVKNGRTWSRVERNSRKWYIASEYLKRM